MVKEAENTPYDFNSIMHYPSCICNPSTCTNTNALFLRSSNNTVVPATFDFSDGDIASLNAIYTCGTPPGNPGDPPGGGPIQ